MQMVPFTHSIEPSLLERINTVIFVFDCEQVKFTEKRMSFLHFITNVCAIVGGKDLQQI